MLSQPCVPPSQPESARQPEEVLALPFGHSLLQGQYRIERELMAGGFGITYLARDSLDRQVVIKECFPTGFCIREGVKVATHSPYRAKSFKNILRHFLREAQWLAHAKHDNIVSVHQVFKENGTAYIAMDCIDGCDLVTLCGDDPKRLDQTLLSHLLQQALQALSVLHSQGVLHRDVSPDNFLIDDRDHLTLIDFGAACGMQGETDTALGAMLSVKDGYSPHEFYQPDMPQRMSCDLYALGATLYFLVTGAPPADAQRRLKAVTAGYADPCPLLEDGDWPFAPEFLRAIDKAMSILPGMRFQTAAEWMDWLPDQLPNFVAADPMPVAPRIPTIEGKSIIPEAVISDLVATTNKQLVPGHGQTPPPDKRATQEPDTPPQMVDIFGEPVVDVDQWLEAQDQMARSPRNDDRDGTLATVDNKNLSAQTPAAATPAVRGETQKSTPQNQRKTRDSGWADRVARIWGTDNRMNAMTANGKTT